MERRKEPEKICKGFDKTKGNEKRWLKEVLL